MNQEVIDLTNNITGIKDGLRATKTTRNNMGFWEIQTDISELIQGAEIETEVLYQVKNESEVDYLSKSLIQEFTTREISGYKDYIQNIKRLGNITCFGLIGKTYYTGIIDSSVSQVSAKVGKIQDYASDLEFRSGAGLATERNKPYNKATGQTEINLSDYMKIIDLYNGNQILKHKTTGEIITAIKDGSKYYKVNTSSETIKTVIKTENDIGMLTLNEGTNYKRFTATLGINGLTPNGKLDFENYIAEIMSYSTPTGRPDKGAIAGNLKDKYVYSQDMEITLEASERDEFQGERISIVPPTGENKKVVVILVSAIAGGMAIIAVGAILIKKYAIK